MRNIWIAHEIFQIYAVKVGDFTNTARCNQIFDRQKAWAFHVVIPKHGFYTMFLRHRHHCPRIRHRCRHRFFAPNVFAGFRSRLGHVPVGEVRRTNAYNINIIRFADFAPITSDTLKIKTVRMQITRVFVCVKQGHQFDINWPIERCLAPLPSLGMCSAHETHAQNANAQFFQSDLIFGLPRNVNFTFHV